MFDCGIEISHISSMKFLFSFILLIFAVSTFGAGTTITQLLQDSRSDIKFLPMSTDDRLKIINFSKLLFSNLYVNFEHKITTYHIDPIKDLTEIENKVESMNESEFHSAILNVYNSFNDLHTGYFLPKPYSCYSAFLPLSFNKTGTGKIIVSAIDLKMQDRFPEILSITPGDEVLEYQKLPLQKILTNRAKYIPASTPDARFLQGIFDLVWRDLAVNIIPDTNSVDIKFMKQNGDIYKLNIPWFTRHKSTCVSNNLKKSTSINLSNSSILENVNERSIYFAQMKRSNNALMLKNSSIKSFSENNIDLTNLNSTDHPDLLWKKFQFRGLSLGYVKLNSFTDPNRDADKTSIDFFNAMLSDHLSDTQGLVIDLRGNYGGVIFFAEELVALFSPRSLVKPLPFYIRATDETKAILENSKENPWDATWYNLINSAKKKNSIVGPLNMTFLDDLLILDQAYKGKIVLLTNSECFSSCDLFVAAMKDNLNVKIYGTDHSTFGGGANVIESDLLEKLVLKSPLPQGIKIRMTLRHAHRLSDNSLIDDVGVATDIFIPESVEELINPKSSAIIAKIFDDLAVSLTNK